MQLRRDIHRLVLAAGSHYPGFAVPFLKRLLSSSTFLLSLYYTEILPKVNEIFGKNHFLSKIHKTSYIFICTFEFFVV